LRSQVCVPRFAVVRTRLAPCLRFESCFLHQYKRRDAKDDIAPFE
jgi:hypothetical protein